MGVIMMSDIGYERMTKDLKRLVKTLSVYTNVEDIRLCSPKVIEGLGEQIRVIGENYEISR